MPILLHMEFTEPRPLYGGGEIPLVMDLSFRVSPGAASMTFSEQIMLKTKRKLSHFIGTRNING